MELVDALLREPGLPRGDLTCRFGDTLYAESLSAPTGPAPTHVQTFRYNIETLLPGMRAN
jgi:hypothetical protein